MAHMEPHKTVDGRWVVATINGRIYMYGNKLEAQAFLCDLRRVRWRGNGWKPYALPHTLEIDAAPTADNSGAQ